MSAEVGVVIKIEHSDLAEVVRLSNESWSICDKGCVLQFSWTNRNDTAQLPAEFRFRKKAVINGQRLVWKFVYPVHVLPFDEEIHWVKESTDTDCHVVVQKVGGLRHFQIDRCLFVFELEFHLAFEEKPIGQFPEKKRIERGIEERILATGEHQDNDGAGEVFVEKNRSDDGN